ncbi:MAG: Uncharacterised protein [Flavobacteriia bacterium]|nr:MAG: Uncharacterised protein [Flavobacteriia bacterium]
MHIGHPVCQIVVPVIHAGICTYVHSVVGGVGVEDAVHRKVGQVATDIGPTSASIERFIDFLPSGVTRTGDPDMLFICIIHCHSSYGSASGDTRDQRKVLRTVGRAVQELTVADPRVHMVRICSWHIEHLNVVSCKHIGYSGKIDAGISGAVYTGVADVDRRGVQWVEFDGGDPSAVAHGKNIADVKCRVEVVSPVGGLVEIAVLRRAVHDVRILKIDGVVHAIAAEHPIK